MFMTLLINECIIVTFLILLSHLYKRSELLPQKKINAKIFTGIVFGIAGCLLISSSNNIRLYNEALDWEGAPILITAIYGSQLTCLISGILIAAYHLLLSGFSSNSIIYILAALTLTAVCSYFIKYGLSKKVNWLLFSSFSIIITSIAQFISLRNLSHFLISLLIYIPGFCTCSYLNYRICTQIIKNKKSLRQLEIEASEDFLTGLKNTRSFNKYYKYVIQSVLRNNEYLSLLIIDIDYFKVVNDTYGHDAGNIVLKEASLLIRSICKSSDIIYRIGGEEFAVVLHKYTRAETADLAEKIRSSIESHKFKVSDNSLIRVTISVGAASHPETTRDTDKLLKQADSALYKAKNSGRNKVCFNSTAQNAGNIII